MRVFPRARRPTGTCSARRGQPTRARPAPPPPPPLHARADIKKEFDKKYGPTWHVIVGRCVLRRAKPRGARAGNAASRARAPPVAALGPLLSRSNFGSYVTHETKHFIYFYLGQVAILCFKSG